MEEWWVEVNNEIHAERLKFRTTAIKLDVLMSFKLL